MRVEVVSGDDRRCGALRRRCGLVERPFNVRMVLLTGVAAILVLVVVRVALSVAGIDAGAVSAGVAVGAVVLGNVLATWAVKMRVDGTSGAAADRRRRTTEQVRPWWRANPVSVSGGSWVPARRPWTGLADRGALLASDEGLLFVPGRTSSQPMLLAWSDVEGLSVVEGGLLSVGGIVLSTTTGEHLVRTSRGSQLVRQLRTADIVDRPA